MTNLRLALRLMRRQPMVSSLAVVALALGIGLTTLMFSILNGAVLRGLPFERSERLLHIAPFDIKENDDFEATQWEYAEWRARQRSFEDLTAFYVGNANVVGPDGTPQRQRGAWITPNTFSMLRARPMLGRDFTDAEGKPGAEPVVIISDRVWRDRFAARTDVLGQTLRVNGTSMTVIGVMPPGFAYPMLQELWIALAVNPAREAKDTLPTLELVGRLKDESSRDQASAELATIAAQVAQEDPQHRDGITVEIKPYVEEFLGTQTVSLLTMMLAAVLLVLVIACVNVANLVLARAADRTRELAVRTALGAQRWQVVRQTLIEVLVLATVGAALGLGIAYAGAVLFNQNIRETSPPFWIDIRIDRTVLLFVAGVTALAALVAGLVPALRASRADVMPLLNDEGRGTTSLKIGRLSRGLVIAEMALSFALLVVSGLVIQSILNVTRFDPGIATRDVLTARVVLPSTEYPDGPSRTRFADALLARVAAVPGVARAALSTTNPPQAAEMSVVLPGQVFPDERDYPRAHVSIVSDGFFDVVRMSPQQGRVFTPGDSADAPRVAVVNETFARLHYPDGAIGRQVRTFSPGTAAIATRAEAGAPRAGGAEPQWHTIVGVVQDVEDFDLGGSMIAGIYLPLSQRPAQSMNVLLQAKGDPLALTSAVRQTVGELDRNLPIFNVMTLQQNLDSSAWGWRVFGTLFTAFGVAALFLASVGLYGVMAFSVSRRTQEFGVRMAVGAAGGDVLRMVLRQGAWQVGIGVALGLGLAMALANAMRLMFFRISPYEPMTFIAVGVLLLVTGLAAAVVPARRAARVDPMSALRTQ